MAKIDITRERKYLLENSPPPPPAPPKPHEPMKLGFTGGLIVSIGMGIVASCACHNWIAGIAMCVIMMILRPVIDANP